MLLPLWRVASSSMIGSFETSFPALKSFTANPFFAADRSACLPTTSGGFSGTKITASVNSNIFDCLWKNATSTYGPTPEISQWYLSVLKRFSIYHHHHHHHLESTEEEMSRKEWSSHQLNNSEFCSQFHQPMERIYHHCAISLLQKCQRTAVEDQQASSIDGELPRHELEGTCARKVPQILCAHMQT